jgi:hypothetical protein
MLITSAGTATSAKPTARTMPSSSVTMRRLPRRCSQILDGAQQPPDIVVHLAERAVTRSPEQEVGLRQHNMELALGLL